MQKAIDSTVKSCRDQITDLGYPLFALQPRRDKAGIINCVVTELRNLDKQDKLQVVGDYPRGQIQTTSPLYLVDLPEDSSEAFSAKTITPHLPVKRGWFVPQPRSTISISCGGETAGISTLGAVLDGLDTTSEIIYRSKNPGPYSLVRFHLEANFQEELAKVCGPSSNLTRFIDTFSDQRGYGSQYLFHSSGDNRGYAPVGRTYITVRILSNQEEFFEKLMDEFGDNYFPLISSYNSFYRGTHQKFLVVGTMCMSGTNESYPFAVLLRIILDRWTEPGLPGQIQQLPFHSASMPGPTLLRQGRWFAQERRLSLGEVLYMDEERNITLEI
jgi:hypothetical protein